MNWLRLAPPRRITVCWLLMILAGVCAAPANAALNHNPRSVAALSRAYGFVLGQEFSLARIESTFPALQTQVKMAGLAFGSGFPNIKQKLEKELTNAFGDAKFKELQAELRKKIRGLLSKQKMTLETSRQFLELVMARGKGKEIEPGVLNYLLAVKYAEYPVGEFGDGFRQIYRTDGSGKSQGLRFHLQLPASWVAKEGERPHVVQKWVSEGGTGLSNIILMVQDTSGETPSRAEVDQFVSSGEIRSMAPEGGTYIAGGAFSQEKSAGYWMEYSLSSERAGMKMDSRGFMYLLFFRGKAISLICAHGMPDQNKAKVEAMAVKLKPLCQQAMNSVVLDQAY